jgi:hypothetical protein
MGAKRIALPQLAKSEGIFFGFLLLGKPTRYASLGTEAEAGIGPRSGGGWKTVVARTAANGGQEHVSVPALSGVTALVVSVVFVFSHAYFCFYIV